MGLGSWYLKLRERAREQNQDALMPLLLENMSARVAVPETMAPQRELLAALVGVQAGLFFKFGAMSLPNVFRQDELPALAVADTARLATRKIIRDFRTPQPAKAG